MALAYQCDCCEDYRTGKGFRIEWTDSIVTQHVTLCPICAAVPKEYLRGLDILHAKSCKATATV